MKRKILNIVAAALIVVGIVAVGITIPRILLDRQRTRLISESGSVAVNSIAPYGSNKRGLTERIGKQSTLITKILVNNVDELITVNSREPMDTELSQDAAVDKAIAFFNEFLRLSEEYGYNFFSETNNSSYGTDVYDEETEAETVYTHSEFWVSVEDTSLSLWVVSFPGAEIIMDAVSGFPIFCVLYPVDSYFVIKNEKELDAFWTISSEIYNSSYAEQFNFQMESDKPIYVEKTDSIISRGKSDPYTLEVKITGVESDYVKEIEIRLKI